MAHRDYNCCAVCDVGMKCSGFDARVKEELCFDCIRSTLFRTGILIVDAKGLMKWIESAHINEIDALDIRPCFYENSVDNAVKLRLNGGAER